MLTEEVYIACAIVTFFVAVFFLRKADWLTDIDDEFGFWLFGWVMTLVLAGGAGALWPGAVGIGLTWIPWAYKQNKMNPSRFKYQYGDTFLGRLIIREKKIEY